MSSNTVNHQCRNYEPIDFDTGYCHFNQMVVLANGATCQYFDRLPRCQNCQHFGDSVAGYLGSCQAFPENPMIFPDRLGVTCGYFEWDRK